MPKPAAIYLRRSTDRQEQSLDDQRAALVAFAVERGFDIVAEYKDDAISGADTQARKAFLKLIDDGQVDRKRRKFHHVLVYDVSRFGVVANDEAGYYRHLLTQAGVTVHYASEGLRGDDTDDLLLGTKQWVAHRMVVDLSKITIRGQISRIDKGRFGGGRPPTGYDVMYFDGHDVPACVIRFLDTGDREIRNPDGSLQRVVPRGEQLLGTARTRAQLTPGDPAKVALIERIFAWYVFEEVGFSTIAERLNATGVNTCGRGRGVEETLRGWNASTIREILRNPAYRGATAWNRISYAKFHRVAGRTATRRSTGEMRKVARNAEADWIVVEDTHPPLIPPDQWRRAQQLMKERAGRDTAKHARATKANSAYLLSGLVRCSRCGSRWQGYKTCKGRRKEGQKRIETFYYACGGYVSKGNAVCARSLVGKEDFETVVMNNVRAHLTAFLANGGAPLLEALVAEAAGEGTGESREAALRAKLSDQEKKIDELVACLTPALAAVLTPKIVLLKAEADATRAALEDLEHAKASAASATDIVRAVVETVTAVGAALETATFHERREIVRGLTREITINPETCHGAIRFHGVPKIAPSENAKRTAHAALSSLLLMAGASLSDRESTFTVRRRWRAPRIAA